MDESYILQDIQFEWNHEKAENNFRKHGVDFQTACEVFFDPFLLPSDEQIIDGELRDTVVGMAENWQILYVVYLIRNDIVRLISARPVTKREMRDYENQ